MSSSSMTNIDEAVVLLSSLINDVMKLASENSISLGWCMEAMNLLKKIHSKFLHFLEKSEVPPILICNGVNSLDEYMKETLNLLDLCNLLKSAIFRMDRYRLMVDIGVGKLCDDEFPDATKKLEIERLEKESQNLYGVEKWKNVDLYKSRSMTSSTKIKIKDDSTICVVYAVKNTMTIIALLIFSAIIYPLFPIKMDNEEVYYRKFPQLKPFSNSIKKLVGCFHKKCYDGDHHSRSVLVESKIIENAVDDIKAQVIRGTTHADKEKYLKSVDFLKKGTVFLKEGLERFESLVTELFDDVVKGRNKVLGMVTATHKN